ncbi:nuclear transport factor 2 family protein [Oceanicoccus sp. KOV_DT_Chl]|uniref:nuclear transport factor 2 family protein n=1 Tax=Oceanicoccus sp. KOV_DT_Chl TaxID=1904639 RepID=UPI000C7E3724|nr:nuclear transport factor 2 family protein [Oceanicoccus sp. KOV_DT_Chl]
MSNCYKAQEMSMKSKEYALTKNREGWLGMFTDDAVVMDPVGVSPMDPTGLGHNGKAAISAFYDKHMATANLVEFEIQHSIPAGDSCANLVYLKNQITDDLAITQYMIVVYTANDEGMLTSLKAHWEWKKLEEQLSGAA